MKRKNIHQQRRQLRRQRVPSVVASKRLTPPKAKRHGRFYTLCARLDEWLEHNPVMRLVAYLAAALTLGSVLYTMWGIRVQLEDSRLLRAEIQETRDFRLQERIELSKQQLRRREGGDTGKGSALAFLIAQEAITYPIDLTCSAIGLYENDLCIAGPIFTDAIPSIGSRMKPPTLSLYLEETGIYRSDFKDFDVSLTARDSLIGSSDLTGASIYIQATGLKFEESDLANAEIYGQASDFVIQNSNVSATNFDDLAIKKGSTLCFIGEGSVNAAGTPCDYAELAESFQFNWFWADAPPDLPLEFLESITSEARNGPLYLVSTDICQYDQEKAERSMFAGFQTVMSINGKPPACKIVSLDEAVRLYPDRYGPNRSDCIILDPSSAGARRQSAERPRCLSAPPTIAN